jgi:hypothetical protein
MLEEPSANLANIITPTMGILASSKGNAKVLVLSSFLLGGIRK